MARKWNKPLEVSPPTDRDVLVWTGYHFIVATADIFNVEQFAEDIKDLPQAAELTENLRKSVGCFEEFGMKHYFDNPKIRWTELPRRPRV